MVDSQSETNSVSSQGDIESASAHLVESSAPNAAEAPSEVPLMVAGGGSQPNTSRLEVEEDTVVATTDNGSNSARTTTRGTLPPSSTQSESNEVDADNVAVVRPPRSSDKQEYRHDPSHKRGTRGGPGSNSHDSEFSMNALIIAEQRSKITNCQEQVLRGTIQDAQVASTTAHPGAFPDPPDRPTAQHVLDEDLPVAEEIKDPPVAQEVPEDRRGSRGDINKHGWVVAILLIVVVSIAVSKSEYLKVIQEDDEGENSPSDSTTPEDDVMTIEDKIFSLLPDSVERILAAPSPQSRAYQWVLEDPQLHDYEDWRIVQRFALATFYYATGGDTSWTDNDGWLSYDVPETQWNITSHNFLDSPLTSDFVIPKYITDPIIDRFAMDQLHDEEISHIWLNANGLQGHIPPELFLLTKLRSLDLGSNQLTGTLPSEVGILEELQFLRLYSTKMSGWIPTEVGNLKSLMVLLNCGSEFSGPIPTELGRLDPLMIHMDNNHHAGTLPTELGLMTRLLGLHLFHNELTGPIPSEVGQMTSLHTLELNENDLTGSIPSELGNFNSDGWSWYSKGVALHKNHLTGSIPTELGKLTALRYLTIFNNNITGAIPSEIGTMTDLELLLLHDNHHTSTIPAELGNLMNLTGMALSGNQLSGTIPAGFTSMTALNFLWLQINLLTGTIPPFKTQFSSNETFADEYLATGLWKVSIEGPELKLSHNFFQGTLPPQLCRLNSSKTTVFVCEDSLCGCDCPCG